MDFRAGALKIGRLFGINVRVHVLFLAWMGFCMLRAGTEWAFYLQLSVTVFAVVLCHEFGHCFGARAVGGTAEDIVLWPLGGLAYAEAPRRPWPQFVTVACGPLVNFAFCLVSGYILILAVVVHAIIHGFTTGPSHAEFGATGWEYLLLLFFYVNLVLLGFNLLPIFPLDGGQLLRVLLWRCIGFDRAAILSAKIGVVGAGVLGAAGVMSQDMTLVLIAVFGGVTSLRHYRAGVRGLATEGLLRADRVLRAKTSPRGPAESAPPGPSGPATTEAGGGLTPAEVDRIVKKASDLGLGSLTYAERQVLERAARQRRRDAPADDGAPPV